MAQVSNDRLDQIARAYQFAVGTADITLVLQTGLTKPCVNTDEALAAVFVFTVIDADRLAIMQLHAALETAVGSTCR